MFVVLVFMIAVNQFSLVVLTKGLFFRAIKAKLQLLKALLMQSVSVALIGV